jgi:hypothetical protein
MKRGDEELLRWVMLRGKGDVAISPWDVEDRLALGDQIQVLMAKGYVDRRLLYDEQDRIVLFVTSTGLYRLNQLQANEVRRLKRKLKEKQNE